jgi:hypothetical protein
MATLPKEQVTQRAAKTLVTYTSGIKTNANTIVAWAATTAGNDVTVTDQITAPGDLMPTAGATLTATPNAAGV